MHAALDLWHLEAMGITPEARKRYGTGKGAVVAVVDTGVDCTHPELADADLRAREKITWSISFLARSYAVVPFSMEFAWP